MPNFNDDYVSYKVSLGGATENIIDKYLEMLNFLDKKNDWWISFTLRGGWALMKNDYPQEDAILFGHLPQKLLNELSKFERKEKE